MKCSVKANEQMGFLAFMMSERSQSEGQKMLRALLESTDEQADGCSLDMQELYLRQ